MEVNYENKMKEYKLLKIKERIAENSRTYFIVSE